MIDTIKMWIDEPPELAHLQNMLTGVRETQDRDAGWTTTSGKLDNLYIKANTVGISISGSLNRYFKGSNLLEFTRDEVEDAMAQLEETLKAPVKEGKVYRFDMSSNLTMEEPANLYVNASQKARASGRYQRCNYEGETTMFTNGVRTVKLYDKLKEMKTHKQPIPPGLEGKNMLRCEVQFQKRLKQQFKEPVTAGLLYDPRFYEKAIDFWERELVAIEMEPRVKIPEEIKGKIFIDHLTLQGIESIGGQQVCFEMLHDARTKGLLKKQPYDRLKARIKKLATDDRITVKHEAAEELRTKVRQTAQYHRMF